MSIQQRLHKGAVVIRQKTRSLSDHVKFDLGLNVSMELNGDGVLTQRADHTLRQTNFALVDLNTGGTNSLGNVASTD